MPFRNPFRLRSTIAETVGVDGNDTLRTKRALRRLGYYEPPKSHGVSIGMTEIPDRELFDGTSGVFRKIRALSATAS